MKINYVALVLLALVLAPLVQADTLNHRQYTITGGLGATDTVVADWTVPDETIPKGGSFYASVTIYSDDGFTVDADLYQLHGGCSLDHQHKNVTSGQSVSLALYINMNEAEVCSVHVIATVKDGAPTIHQFHLTDNVASYQITDLGQSPSTALGAYWLPLIVFLGLLWWSVETGQPIIYAGAIVGALLTLGGQFAAPISLSLALALVIFSMAAVGLPKVMKRGLNPFRRERN